MAVHWPEQHSGAAAQVSPDTRHSGLGPPHLPAAHSPEQQSLTLVQAPLAGTQRLPPQVPPVQPSPQQAPARLQVSPALAHPTDEAQVSCPLPSCWQR
jgi:hypothetical protein